MRAILSQPQCVDYIDGQQCQAISRHRADRLVQQDIFTGSLAINYFQCV